MHVPERGEPGDLAIDGHHVRPPGVAQGDGGGAPGQHQLLEHIGGDVVRVERGPWVTPWPRHRSPSGDMQCAGSSGQQGSTFHGSEIMTRFEGSS